MNTNFLLVSIAGMPKILSDFIPDIGMASLAASLIEKGHKVKILDLNMPGLFNEVFTPGIKKTLEKFSRGVFLEKKNPSIKDIFVLKRASRRLEKNKRIYCDRLKGFLAGFIARENIGAVGFKLWAGEGFTWSVEAGRHLRKMYPDLKVFGGGPQVDIFGQDIYKAGDFFDALCYCEGEESICMLADFVQGREKLDNIPNIIFRRESGEIVKNPKKHIDDLDGLPFPVYDPEVYVGIGEKLKILVLEESRGCPNACHFCIHPVKSGKRRTKSVQKVVGEIKKYGEKYGVRVFKYAGSSTPGDFMADVAAKIIDEKLDVRYTGFGHVNDFNVDFELLKKSGCESIFFGVESANEEILKRGMNKNIKKDDMEKVLVKSMKAGIFTVVSLIYPAPFENSSSREETLSFIKKVRPDSVLVQFPGIYPGTMWFKHPERFNFRFLLKREDYPFRVMTYQIKNLFPPRYWDPLPYTVNGMPFKVFASETGLFQKELNEEGIETSVSDEAYILYSFGPYGSIKEFLNTNRYLFYSGNGEKLSEEIAYINRKAGINGK